MHKTEWGPIELDGLVKSKEPLFITEDEVEIFEDYEMFCVPKKGTMISFKSNGKAFIDSPFTNKNYKYFSTEKAAKDWIDLNKPMYSKKQIMDAALVKYVTGTILLHIKDIK